MKKKTNKYQGSEAISTVMSDKVLFSISSCQRGGSKNWLHHAEHPVHAHREQRDHNRCGTDGEQAKRKCLH